MSTISAVLTGDLIESSNAEPDAVERAMRILSATADSIAGWQGPPTDTRFTRFRGDGWQMMLSANPELALRAAIVLQASLRAAGPTPGTRIAIGLGHVDHFGSKDLSDARGTAFERSGQTLDSMGRTRRLTLAAPGLSPLADIIFDLIDERMTRWTPEQAEAAALYLLPDNPTLAAIAGPLAISPQAVSYRLGGAGGARLRKSLSDWEDELRTSELDKVAP
ncbi:hypothetical protein [Pseudooceanicola sp.]|uniref:hypothetical protein n=1 Tax=Pseudooceanicola sp. TaxID=1914328 RepID=UPI00260E88DE|nr:hypothetical protein [Pseudooceanicola sp.]MDF1853853.1 hypothetical protein [Pseudooceanicola sp.]